MHAIHLNSFETLLFALLIYLLGHYLSKRIALLNRYCIPAPVAGGLLSSLAVTLLSAAGIADIRFDNSLMAYFMLIFFTTVGLGANFRLIKLGGKILIVYWLACGFLALAQNFIGVSMASLLGLDPLLGVLAGAVSMEGGHGAAATFGKTIEELGVANAMPVGLAAATLGLVAGSLSGGPVAKKLIGKYALAPDLSAQPRQAADAQSAIDAIQGGKSHWQADKVLRMLALITACCVAGQWSAKGFTALTGFSLPAYVPAMFLAVIVRNVLDMKNTDIVDFRLSTLIGDVSLAVFLTIALMSINLLQIADLALPLVAIVAVQVVFVVAFAYFILFKLLGKNYDAAVMAAGFCGHGLGATPNAVANMDAVTKKYGYSYQAFIIVPVVGAFLIDIFGMPIIITTINLLSTP
ncbi:sodium/glutamate symporter [Bergeriella denitrificans]|uniref:Sodium/glutamate symporter n=1 Tax=Bergeriella denitrificans TaxID=494 RepID=A0A378UGL1_BERDE|nr:sodium/glutamate symporter [Bergeriella denitrificans]STZ76456.1 glutamate permease [Bergeriella denitrificans]